MTSDRGSNEKPLLGGDKKKYSRLALNASYLPDPIDVYWDNTSTHKSVELWKKCTVHILIWSLSMFISTPVAFLQIFKNASFVQGILQGSFLDQIPLPNSWGEYIKSYIIPLVIVCLNTILLLVIQAISNIHSQFTY